MNPANPPRLPAEWEPQAGVMLTWPHANTDWADSLQQVLDVYVQIAHVVSQHQILLSVCRNAQHRAQVESLLRAAGANGENLRFALANSNDTWARDHAALSVLSGEQVLLNDFQFDAWGGKFPAELDNRINAELHHQGIFGHATMRSLDLVLEGGAIETDGQGTLLATRSSLLDPHRNPELSVSDIEHKLWETLGFDRFLWLDHGALSGDDTDAHIDVLARFCDPHTILYTSSPPGDPDHSTLAEMRRQLESFRDRDGQPYRLRELPFAGIHHDADGRRLAAGYANFLITNQAVLLPTFGVPADQKAIALLQECFDGRQVVGIDCRALIEQNGSLHCLTMQFPAGLELNQAEAEVA